MPEDQGEIPQSQDNQPSRLVTRRQFIQKALAAGGDAALAASSKTQFGKVLGEFGGIFNQPPEVPLVAESVIEQEGNRLFLDKDGLPVKLITRDEQEFDVDTEIAKRVKEQSKKSDEPEVLDVAAIKKGEAAEFSEAHPRINKPPEDILSKEELAKRNVSIIQGEDVKLYIRESAFEPGGELADLANSGESLTIVLVDGPIVSRRYLADTKYQPVHDLLHQIPTERLSVGGESYPVDSDEAAQIIKEDQKKVYQEYLENNRARLPQSSNIEETHRNILAIKTELAAVDRLYTDEDFVLSRLYGDHVGPVGLSTYYGERGHYIYIAAGERPERDLLSVYFDPDGKVGIYVNTDSLMDRYDRVPFQNLESHPQASVAEENKSPGWVLRHEIEHLNEQINNPGVFQPEEEMDRRARQGLEQARENWQNSGFGKPGSEDDKKYSIVIQIPEEGRGERYLIT